MRCCRGFVCLTPWQVVFLNEIGQGNCDSLEILHTVPSVYGLHQPFHPWPDILARAIQIILICELHRLLFVLPRFVSVVVSAKESRFGFDDLARLCARNPVAFEKPFNVFGFEITSVGS